VALVNNRHIQKEPRLTDRTDRTWFSRVETERVFFQPQSPHGPFITAIFTGEPGLASHYMYM